MTADGSTATEIPSAAGAAIAEQLARRRRAAAEAWNLTDDVPLLG